MHHKTLESCDVVDVYCTWDCLVISWNRAKAKARGFKCNNNPNNFIFINFYNVIRSIAKPKLEDNKKYTGIL